MAKRQVYKKTTLMFNDTDIAIHEYLSELATRKRSNIQSEIMNLLEEKMNADVRYLNSIVEKEEIKEQDSEKTKKKSIWQAIKRFFTMKD